MYIAKSVKKNLLMNNIVMIDINIWHGKSLGKVCLIINKLSMMINTR